MNIFYARKWFKVYKDYLITIHYHLGHEYVLSQLKKDGYDNVNCHMSNMKVIIHFNDEDEFNRFIFENS